MILDSRLPILEHWKFIFEHLKSILDNRELIPRHLLFIFEHWKSTLEMEFDYRDGIDQESVTNENGPALIVCLELSDCWKSILDDVRQ